MGFPVGYTEVFIPTLLIHTLTLLTLLKNLLSSLLPFLDPPPPPPPVDPTPPPRSPPHSAALLRELLPISSAHDHTCCAVCLCEVAQGEEIRWLTNCRHVFHRECLDRWIDLDRRTCPLCRTPFLSGWMLEEFNRRMGEDEVYDQTVYVEHTLYSSQQYQYHM